MGVFSDIKEANKQQDKSCRGCRYSSYNPLRGLAGAWECSHPNNLTNLPKLSLDLLTKEWHCRLLPAKEAIDVR